MVKKLLNILPPQKEREHLTRCIEQFAKERSLTPEMIRVHYDCAAKLFHQCTGEEWIEELSDAIDEDVSGWLLELPFALASGGLIDEAVEHGRCWAEYIERDNFLADRAVILGEAGRANEARTQIAQLDSEFPEDVWVQIKCGDALLALGDVQEAEVRYRTSFSLCGNDYDREGMLERFIPLLRQQVRNDEADLWKRHAEAAQPLCMAMRDEFYLSEPDVDTVHALQEFFEPYFRWTLSRRAKVGADDRLLPGFADVQAIFFLSDWGIDDHIPDLLTCLSMREEDLDMVYGDILTETMWVPFAKVGQNHIALIERFILDPSHFIHARWAVYSGLVAMHHFHPDRRSDVVAAAEKVFRMPRQFPEDILAALMCDCIESGLTEMSSTAVAFADAMQESELNTFTADDVRDALDSGTRATFITERPTDALSVNRQWEKDYERIANEQEEDLLDDEWDDDLREPSYDVNPLKPFIDPYLGKIGRNDPCPCGSGKKYKKCHGVS